MEKFKEIYFYIQTKAYKANTDEGADPGIAQCFYEETREIFWNLGFTLGRDYALKENSCLQIGVMTFRGNLKEALIPEVEQALKTAETFRYSHYNDYGDTFLLSETEQETYFQDHLADYEKRFLKPLKEAAVTRGWALGWIVLSSLWKAILFCAEDIIRRTCISSVFLKSPLTWKKRDY